MATTPTQGSQGERTPKAGGGFGSETGMGDLLSVGLRYGIPLAYLGANQRQIKKLRSKASPDLNAPDLMTGSVHDMARPKPLRSSPEMGGSSLAEYMNTGLARDAFNQQQSNQFETQNSMFRQQQESQILDRTNQNIQNKANVDNQESLFQAQAAVSELLGYAIPDRTSTIESIFHNIDRDVYNAGVVKDTKEVSMAQEVLRHPDGYSADQQSWARGVLTSSGMPMKKGGGKLRRTKYSVAR